MLGVSRFQNKVAVVAGAEHPLGAALCTRLAGFGATVVAIGKDDLALRALASRHPNKIEPLAMHSGWRDILRLLKEAWEEQPINIYVDMLPLMGDGAAEDDPEAFARSAGLTAALKLGMIAGRTLGVVAIPTENEFTDGQSRQSGYSALLAQVSSEIQPARMLGVGLPVADKDWSHQKLVSATDTILMLCHPVSRGVKPGMVIDWTLELR